MDKQVRLLAGVGGWKMSGSSRKCQGGREEWPGVRVGSGAPRTGSLSPQSTYIHSSTTAVAILDGVMILPDPSSIKIFVQQHLPLPFEEENKFTLDLLFLDNETLSSHAFARLQ